MISSYNDFASVPMMHGQDGQGAEWRTGSLEPPAIQTNLTNASDEEEEKGGGGQMRFKTVHAGVLGECSAQLTPLALQSLPFFSLNASRPCENGVWSARSLQLSLSLLTRRVVVLLPQCKCRPVYTYLTVCLYGATHS